MQLFNFSLAELQAMIAKDPCDSPDRTAANAGVIRRPLPVANSVMIGRQIIRTHGKVVRQDGLSEARIAPASSTARGLQEILRTG